MSLPLLVLVLQNAPCVRNVLSFPWKVCVQHFTRNGSVPIFLTAEVAGLRRYPPATSKAGAVLAGESEGRFPEDPWVRGLFLPRARSRKEPLDKVHPAAHAQGKGWERKRN